MDGSCTADVGQCRHLGLELGGAESHVNRIGDQVFGVIDRAIAVRVVREAQAVGAGHRSRYVDGLDFIPDQGGGNWRQVPTAKVRTREPDAENRRSGAGGHLNVDIAGGDVRK